MLSIALRDLSKIYQIQAVIYKMYQMSKSTLIPRANLILMPPVIPI